MLYKIIIFQKYNINLIKERKNIIEYIDPVRMINSKLQLILGNIDNPFGQNADLISFEKLGEMVVDETIHGSNNLILKMKSSIRDEDRDFEIAFKLKRIHHFFRTSYIIVRNRIHWLRITPKI
ncbi:hypothetical protein ACFL56_00495, partial [Candidatus Margulisiibacteriota bacterium]